MIGDIKTDFPTEKFYAEVIDLNCRVEMVSVKQPKSVKFFTVCFEPTRKKQ